MRWLQSVSRAIDACTEWLGRCVRWLVLLSVLVAAFSALGRRLFGIGSNALLESQWYMLAGIVLLGGSYALLHRTHLRVDALYLKYPARVRWWFDVLTLLLIVLPVCVFIAWVSWPYFIESLNMQEVSSAPGGLTRWPVKLFIPLGFLLLSLQAVSELIKLVSGSGASGYAHPPAAGTHATPAAR